MDVHFGSGKPPDLSEWDFDDDFSGVHNVLEKLIARRMELIFSENGLGASVNLHFDVDLDGDPEAPLPMPTVTVGVTAPDDYFADLLVGVEVPFLDLLKEAVDEIEGVTKSRVVAWLRAVADGVEKA